MAKSATKPAFGAGVLSGLRAAAGAAGGEPRFLLLEQVEEDPDQSRTSFDQAELEQLAETIHQYGVLTLVGVRNIGVTATALYMVRGAYVLPAWPSRPASRQPSSPRTRPAWPCRSSRTRHGPTCPTVTWLQR